MNNQDLGCGAMLAVLVFIVLILSGVLFPIVYASEFYEVRNRAVQKDHAYYDTKTGEFTWSDNTSKYIFTGQE